ncbi:anti sigma factor C-terminal domain-containing protein [Pseudobacteroides cellulosolvens]|uniref:Sigma factor regulator C-terminal domain containing protein n=1 Tax=Pseudobacteroides cellulosolvens ATCC 35603 = DSM 2933 TaxID=398512 RepID=A0A0L6JJN3_9FIRM|nr:anti sigma factor C-terminal domain-containing protein [Pseudobacteroides cellulosolvens]KNY25969.1 Sigma factor regulator C-terminal domain containing protein [Pseudobacteroides cellulosolvens ATCC 35603 = DSM 2933]
MKCNEVLKLLPEYLAGTLDASVKMQVDNHIKNCDACSKEMKLLNEDIKFDFKQNSIIDQSRILKKTRFKFNMAIFRIVLIILGVLFLVLITPFIAWQIRAGIGREDQMRAFMDIIQFTQPNKVNMWGNSALESLSFSESLKIGARPVIGRNYGEQKEYVGKMSTITGKVTVPAYIGADFIHPNLFMDTKFDRSKDVKVQSGILSKNLDNSVATVDYSLKKIISVPEVENLIGNYDVEVSWMAVEAGIENLKPKNISFENQQVLQWGIPGKLSNPGRFHFAEFKKGNVIEYEKLVLEELKWLNENKNILKPDPSLLKDNGIDSSVAEKASHILKNGIKVYGLRITGPSSELVKLTSNLDPRFMTVVDMDFWNW